MGLIPYSYATVKAIAIESDSPEGRRMIRCVTVEEATDDDLMELRPQVHPAVYARCEAAVIQARQHQSARRYHEAEAGRAPTPVGWDDWKPIREFT